MDMYGEKVAEASALIREFAKVDYFHYFARDPESSLEAFIAMQDSAHAAGRASALAEIHPQWLEEKERADRAEAKFAKLSEASVALNNQHVAEQEGQASRIADLERQLAEASAPAADVMMATAQRLIAEVNAGDEDEDEKNLTVRGIGWMHSELVKVMKDTTPSAPAVEQKNRADHETAAKFLRQHDRLEVLKDGTVGYTIAVNAMQHALAAPQAAETDKVREAILGISFEYRGDENFRTAYCRGAESMKQAAAAMVASMAAQAPVREVPEPEPDMLWDAENPEDGVTGHSPKNFAENYAGAAMGRGETHDVEVLCCNRTHNRTMRVSVSADEDVENWLHWEWIDALPAAPVQQEGDHASR